MFDPGGFFSAPPIQAALPWRGSSGGNYNVAYNNALQQNRSNYDNIIAGFQNTIARHTSQQQAIQAGMTGLYNAVLASTKGYGDSQLRSIDDSAAQMAAQFTQGNVDKGLTNSSIQESSMRAVEADRLQRRAETEESMAKLRGDQMSMLGLSGLEEMSRGNQALSGLSLDQLAMMERANAQYPRYDQYADIERMRAEAGGGLGGYAGAGGGFGGGGRMPQLGYTTAGTRMYGSGGYTPTSATGGGGSWMLGQYAGTPYGGGSSYGGSAGYDYGGYGNALGLAEAATAAGASVPGYDDDFWGSAKGYGDNSTWASYEK